ncbi:MAG: MBL fold metallo-hydrolase [Oscillospiraceae bacterium]
MSARRPSDGRRRKSTYTWQSILTVLVIAAIYLAAQAVFPEHFSGDTTVPAISSSALWEASAGSSNIESMQLHIVDVGQGSSALLLSNGHAVLIDGGERDQGDELLHYLSEVGVTQLDAMVISHLHTDHYGGLIAVLGTLPVAEVLMPDTPQTLVPTNSTYERLLDALESSGTLVTLVTKPRTLEVGRAKLSILGPFLPEPSNLNNTSLVVRVDAGDASALVMGDAETAAEDALRESGTAIDVDILVAGHHGSNTSSKQHFLDAVTPKASVVSVGLDNSYQLPSAKTLERLKMFGNIYRTDLGGSIVLSTDGEMFSIVGNNISTQIDVRG